MQTFVLILSFFSSGGESECRYSYTFYCFSLGGERDCRHVY